MPGHNVLCGAARRGTTGKVVSMQHVSFLCLNLRFEPVRHGPEVPKFVFMAVGFETYGHASRMAQLITFSEESPPTYILLNLKNSISVHLNRTPTGPDI